MWMLWTALASPSPLTRCVEAEALGPHQAEQVVDARRASLSDPRGASDALERLTRVAAGCDAVWMAYAAALHSQGRSAEAIDALREAAAVAAGPEAGRALAVALAGQGDGGEVLQQAVRDNPGDPLLHLLAARELPPSERPAALRRGVELHPHDGALALELLRTLDEAGRPAEAIAFGHEAVARVDDGGALRAELERIEAPFLREQARRKQRPDEFRVLGDGTTEIVVYRPDRALEALVARLEALGYTNAKPIKGGAAVRYTSDRSVSPNVDVYTDGRVEVQKGGLVGAGDAPQGRTMIPWISRKKLAPDRTRVLEAIQYEITAYRQALTAEAFQSQLNERLPAQLTVLWERGVPLYGEGVLADELARRDALTAHWATRGCSPEGDAARDVVERFLANVVQDSEVALDPAGVERVEAASACEGRALTRLRQDLGMAVEAAPPMGDAVE